MSSWGHWEGLVILTCFPRRPQLLWNGLRKPPICAITARSPSGKARSVSAAGQGSALGQPVGREACVHLAG